MVIFRGRIKLRLIKLITFLVAASTLLLIAYIIKAKHKARIASTECPKLSYAGDVIDRQVFQKIGTASNNLVFSAFLVRINPTFSSDREVKILAVLDGDGKTHSQTFFCQIWSSREELVIVQATRSVMVEYHGTRYYGCWFKCPVPDSSHPEAVSLVTERCNSPLNLLPVQNALEPPDGVYEKDFTVCITPLNRSYKRTYELIEKIELDRMFGADYFVFYNFSIGPNINKIFNYYKGKQLLDVVDWQLPFKLDEQQYMPDIHYYGQVLALNDCVLRHARKSRHIVVTDLDEIIVPLLHSNWAEMLKHISENTNKTFGTNIFMFACAFFRKDWPDSSDDFPSRNAALKYRIMSLLKTQRQPVLPPNVRMKSIVDPRFVEVMGIHYVLQSKKGAVMNYIPTDIGLQFHYRDFEKPLDMDRRSQPFMLKYATLIADRISQVWDDLKHQIPLPEDCNC